MTFIDKKKKLFFLSRGTTHTLSAREPFDLLLSPQFYLMQKKRLTIRFGFEAKRLAPSILEELGAKPDWQFEVFKEDEDWVFVAYDPMEVEKALGSLGLETTRVHRVFFAQQIATQLQRPLRVGEEELLTLIEGTVVILPPSLLPVASAIDNLPGIENISRPEKGFSFPFSSGGKWISTEELMLLTALLFILGFIWTVEGLHYRKEVRNLENSLHRWGKDYPRLENPILRDNIYHKYANIDKHQRQLRETLKKIGSLTSKDSKLTSLKMDQKGYTVAIETHGAKKNEVMALSQRIGFTPKSNKDEIILHGAWDK